MTTAQQELFDYMAARRCRQPAPTDFDAARLAKPVIVAALLIVASLVCLVWLDSAAPQANATYQGLPPVATPAPAKLTMDSYLELQEGMSLTEVFLTLGVGVDYQEVSTTGPLQTFQFRDGHRSVFVMLQSGRLVSKLQSGL